MHCKENLHVTPFNHYISKTARSSISSPLVKKSYLGGKLLNPEYQVIASESVNTPPGPSVQVAWVANELIRRARCWPRPSGPAAPGSTLHAVQLTPTKVSFMRVTSVYAFSLCSR